MFHQELQPQPRLLLVLLKDHKISWQACPVSLPNANHTSQDDLAWGVSHTLTARNWLHLRKWSGSDCSLNGVVIVLAGKGLVGGGTMAWEQASAKQLCGRNTK